MIHVLFAMLFAGSASAASDALPTCREFRELLIFLDSSTIRDPALRYAIADYSMRNINILQNCPGVQDRSRLQNHLNDMLNENRRAAQCRIAPEYGCSNNLAIRRLIERRIVSGGAGTSRELPEAVRLSVEGAIRTADSSINEEQISSFIERLDNYWAVESSRLVLMGSTDHIWQSTGEFIAPAPADFWVGFLGQLEHDSALAGLLTEPAARSVASYLIQDATTPIYKPVGSLVLHPSLVIDQKGPLGELRILDMQQLGGHSHQ